MKEAQDTALRLIRKAKFVRELAKVLARGGRAKEWMALRRDTPLPSRRLTVEEAEVVLDSFLR